MNIYLLTDGMCEDPYSSTSLMNSKHPNLDNLSKYGQLGFYEPVIRDYIHNPETFIIFPYFFGLNPQNNPGRAGLELFELGKNISKLQSFCIIRIVKKSYDIFQVLSDNAVGSTWTKAPKLSHVDDIQSKINKVNNFVKDVSIVKSPRRDNVWSIGAECKSDLEDTINLIQYILDSTGYNVYSMLMNDFKYTPPKIKNKESISFLGWGFSTLIEAFRFSGIEIHQSFTDIKNHLFDYQNKHQDFDKNILPFMKKRINTEESCILFFKEPSRAARETKTSDLKIESIKFIDSIVGKILNEFEGENVNLIVLSDHQSNIGNKRTYSGSTLYYYGNLSKKRFSERPFSEDNVHNKTILQKELIININKFLKYNVYEE